MAPDSTSFDNVGIIGAGPAGVFAALSVHDFYNVDVTVIDFKKPLSTLLPTGGGRCNFSYFETDIKTFSEYYPRGNKFLLSVFHRFDMNDTVDYFENIGIKAYVQDDNRIFPIANSSEVMAEILLQRAKISGINFRQGKVTDISHDGENFVVKTDDKDYKFNKLIIATGGKSFKLIKKTGHTIITPTPSLTPLEINEKIYYCLSGLSLNNVWAKVYFAGKKITELTGDLLFTANSISGPLAFKISSICAFEKFSEKNPLEIKLNISGQSFTYIDEYLNNFTAKNSRTAIKNSMMPFCPKNLFEIILSENNIDGYKQCAHMTSTEKNTIIKQITELTLHVASKLKGHEIVTAGGVDTNEINSATMESKLVPDLYFVGEVINVDGFTGGFNLQNCWSTARVAAMNLFIE